MFKFDHLVPWLESIPLGSRTAGYARAGKSLYYSTPQEEPVTLFGFHAVITYAFTMPYLEVQLAEAKTPDIWTPFYWAPLEAVAGIDTGGAEIVRMLPSPFVIMPSQRIQIAINAPSGVVYPEGVEHALTLVGVRDLKGGYATA